MSVGQTKQMEIDHRNDREMPQGPADSVSGLSWSLNGAMLAVSAWDNTVRVYEINQATGEGQGRFVYQHDAPATCVCWWHDSSKVISGGADKLLRCYDLATGQASVIGQHDQAIMGIALVDVGQPMIASISLDRTLRYWDLRSNQPVATIQLPERGYAVSSSQKLLVAMCASRQLVLINLDNPQAIFKTMDSPLKQQTQAVACHPNGIGFAVGSIEGRCGIHYLNPVQPQDSFAFKCHRKQVGTASKPVEEVYTVEALAYHPISHAVVTAGSDGVIHFWDAVSRRRLSFTKQQPYGINAIAFNSQGTFMAYASGYDWSKGYAFAKPGTPGVVKVHKLLEWEVKGKPR